MDGVAESVPLLRRSNGPGSPDIGSDDVVKYPADAPDSP